MKPAFGERLRQSPVAARFVRRRTAPETAVLLFRHLPGQFIFHRKGLS